MKAIVNAPDEPGVMWMRSARQCALGYVAAYMAAMASRSGASPRAAV